MATLPFCYLCGKEFSPDDEFNYDHVPPSNVFDKPDKTPPLKLKTHSSCNSKRKVTDELFGQMTTLARDYVTPNPRNRRLKMEVYPETDFGAITNVNFNDEIWRCVRGFHAALYGEPFTGKIDGTMITPFIRARKKDGDLAIEDIKNYHLQIVSTIKNQRSLDNIDSIISNNKKLTYECIWVWAIARSSTCTIPRRRACFFALTIYDWGKLWDVEDKSRIGCFGAYFMPDGHAPTNAAINIESSISCSNDAPLDPFGS